jgi:hypothetical protein
MDATSETTVRTCDHILLANGIGVTHDPLGHDLRVLYHVRRVGHDARDQHLAMRQLDDVTPHLPLVLVTGIRSFTE